jgi:urea carboxylase
MQDNLHDEALGAEALGPHCIGVSSPVSGSVWRVLVRVGQAVKAGETLVLVESMKMELPVSAPADGVVEELRCAEGRAVQVAQLLVSLRPDAAAPVVQERATRESDDA